jgi:flagellar assembly protein FliH
MPLSKTINKEVVAEKVLSFTPRPIERDLTKAAEEFLETKDRNISAFKLSDLVASQAGIAERERNALEERAEHIALSKVKEIQEPAYQEAYALGLEEGRKSAFEKASGEISNRIQKIDELVIGLSKIKNEMLSLNEGQLIKTVYHLAVQIARFEIKEHDDRILGVLKQAVEHAQSQETVTVKLSKEDFEFLHAIKDFNKREFEFMKKIKFDPQAEIKSGGCIVETNFGTIDATLDERIHNLWSAIEPKIAKPKEKIES